ncbi:hypothetical protein KP509_39G052500 [Ceratopteris richardii]|uniref:Uncharacterized protein n=1 Tax=Ceratopteris richardii TaxID=49495 RepID=A0A8T2Q0S6_CERRI|nr:hypothetical protein KP509_39G052500 [Ceratopteris richardii]
MHRSHVDSTLEQKFTQIGCFLLLQALMQSDGKYFFLYQVIFSDFCLSYISFITIGLRNAQMSSGNCESFIDG